jgi:UDP-GlcNAc:undecaprenyl-phosphate/decaprenyl-phosphate GlcNAc-1-phosphate transferase
MSLQYLTGAVAFLVCIAALPAIRRVSGKYGLYDAQGPLKIHQGRIPRLGGVAMMLGLAAGSLLFIAPPLGSRAFLVIAVAMVWIVGLIDDLSGVSSYIRLAVQVAAGALLWFGGWRLNLSTHSIVNLLATCLLVAFLINAMNFLDGMDGLCAGLTAMIALGFLGISAGGGASLGGMVAAGLVGVSLGMLIANFPPATMFMGDSGSTLIGIVLAYLLLNSVRNHPGPQGLVAPSMFLTIPIADAALAILRRAIKGSSVFDGDRQHFYDILLQRGWPVRRVLATSLEAAGILILTGWLYSRGAVRMRLAAILAIGAVAIAAQILGTPRSEPSPAGAPESIEPARSGIE